MLPPDTWLHIVSYLRYASELSAVATALNKSVTFFLVTASDCLKHDVMVCAAAHNKRQIFDDLVGLELCDQIWELTRVNPQFQHKIVEYRQERDLFWTANHVCYAAGNGWLSVVQWLHAQGCPLGKTPCRQAMVGGDYLELVVWLVQHGCPCDAHIYHCALAWGRSRTVAWFLKKEVMGEFIRKHNYLGVSRAPMALLDYTVPLEELVESGAFESTRSCLEMRPKNPPKKLIRPHNSLFRELLKVP